VTDRRDRRHDRPRPGQAGRAPGRSPRRSPAGDGRRTLRECPSGAAAGDLEAGAGQRMTDDDLHTYSMEHLYYELEMLFSWASGLGAPAPRIES